MDVQNAYVAYQSEEKARLRQVALEQRSATSGSSASSASSGSSGSPHNNMPFQSQAKQPRQEHHHQTNSKAELMRLQFIELVHEVCALLILAVVLLAR